MTSPHPEHRPGAPPGKLAACRLFSVWCKAQGPGVSGRLACGLGSEKRGSLNFLFGVFAVLI